MLCLWREMRTSSSAAAIQLSCALCVAVLAAAPLEAAAALLSAGSVPGARVSTTRGGIASASAMAQASEISPKNGPSKGKSPHPLPS